MESPFSWQEAEHVVAEAIKQAERQRDEGRCGFSMVMQITTALRAAGLLAPREPEKEVSERA